MKPKLIWPTCEADLNLAKGDIGALIESTSWEAVADLEGEVNLVLHGKPIGQVLVTLAVLMGKMGAQFYGPLQAQALAPLAIAIQLGWHQTVSKNRKH
jgi:hypothetical protein